jgi:hypothetical protein
MPRRTRPYGQVTRFTDVMSALSRRCFTEDRQVALLIANRKPGNLPAERKELCHASASLVKYK